MMNYVKQRSDMIKALFDGQMRWPLGVQWLHQPTLPYQWMWIALRKVEKARKGNPSPLERARTRTKESRNRNKVTKVTILAKGMEINSRLRGVQRDRHGKIHHGTTVQMVLEKVENPKRETKARILEKARM